MDLLTNCQATTSAFFQEDLDDDNDGWNDTDEGDCGSDPLDASSKPSDTDGDGICDALDDEQNAVSAETPKVALPVPLSYQCGCGAAFTTVVVAVDSVTLHGPSEGYLVKDQNLNMQYSNQKLRKIEQWIIHLFSNPLKMLNGTIVFSEEKIDISITPHLNIDIIDLNMEENDQRFMMRDRRASEKVSE